MSYYTPPPPPPPPPAAASSERRPWYRTGGGLFAIGLIVAAAIAAPILYFFVLSGDDDTTAGGTSTTAASSTTGGATTTEAATTTTEAATTTTEAATTTTEAATTTTEAATTTTEAATTTTEGATTTTSAGTELDYTLPANYAEDVLLAAGFAPDPTTWEMSSGGTINASYLGGGCLGWATASPDVEITWTGDGSLLRFYFVADNPGDDTTLIISDPVGNWVCADDWEVGARDPMVDFDTGPDGTYDIWVGSYSDGAYIAGTLYVTQDANNHP